MEPTPAADVVQKLLAEVRRLKVENESLRAHASDLEHRVGRPDPRIGAHEAEIRRLRTELAVARDQRDIVSAGIRIVIERVRAVLPGK